MLGTLARSARCAKHGSTSIVGRVVSKGVYGASLSSAAGLNARAAQGKTAVTLIEGSCGGPEVINTAVHVLDALEAPIDWKRINFSFDELEASSTADNVPEEVIKSVQETKVALMGAVSCPVIDGYTSPAILMRRALNLDHYMVKIKSFEGVKNSNFDNVDAVMFRENTRGCYMGLEHMASPDVAEALTVHDWDHVTNLAKAAFKYAADHGRKSVTCVHKANIIKKTDGLFLEACAAVAKDYPSIEFIPMIVDNTCMQLVSRPDQFDVLVVPNMYGAIVGSVLAGLVGSPGLTCGVNQSASGGYKVYEQGVRQGGALLPTDIANPAGTLLAASQLLSDVGSDMGKKLEAAVGAAIAAGAGTADIGGSSNVSEFAGAVLNAYSSSNN